MSSFLTNMTYEWTFDGKVWKGLGLSLEGTCQSQSQSEHHW